MSLTPRDWIVETNLPHASLNSDAAAVQSLDYQLPFHLYRCTAVNFETIVLHVSIRIRSILLQRLNCQVCRGIFDCVQTGHLDHVLCVLFEHVSRCISYRESCSVLRACTFPNRGSLPRGWSLALNDRIGTAAHRPS